MVQKQHHSRTFPVMKSSLALFLQGLPWPLLSVMVHGGISRMQPLKNSNGGGCSLEGPRLAATPWLSGWLQSHLCILPGQVPFSIFTATVVYPALPFSWKAVALTTFPNSPSPRVFPRTKFFRGNSHLGSSYVGLEEREEEEKGESW